MKQGVNRFLDVVFQRHEGERDWTVRVATKAVYDFFWEAYGIRRMNESTVNF